MILWCFIYFCDKFHTSTINRTILGIEFVKLVWGKWKLFRTSLIFRPWWLCLATNTDQSTFYSILCDDEMSQSRVQLSWEGTPLHTVSHVAVAHSKNINFILEGSALWDIWSDHTDHIGLQWVRVMLMIMNRLGKTEKHNEGNEDEEPEDDQRRKKMKMKIYR